MASITLRGREIPLFYSTLEMKMIQEQIGPISRAVDLMMGRNPDSDDPNDSSRFGGAEHLDALGHTYTEWETISELSDFSAVMVVKVNSQIPFLSSGHQSGKFTQRFCDRC